MKSFLSLGFFYDSLKQKMKTNNLKLTYFHKNFGIKRLIYSYYMTRAIEYPLAFNSMDLVSGMKVLDFGSGNSLFPIYLASQGICTYSSDIASSPLSKMREAVLHSRYKSLINEKLNYIFLNGLKLPFKNDFFDRIFAISTLEHFKDDDDLKSIKELSRVLKPGGKMFISLEFHKDFREIIVPDNKQKKSKTNNARYEWENFVRYYNRKSIFERIISPSRLIEEKMFLFGSPKISIRKYTDTIHFLKYGMVFSPLLTKIFYRLLNTENDIITCANSKPEYLSNIVACMVLKKNREEK